MRKLLFLSFLIGAAAHAQTYDLTIALTPSGSPTMIFAGSFEFDGSATCSATALFCSGLTPQFSNVNVSDGFVGGASAFTEANSTPLGAGEHVSLYDFEGLPPSTSTSLKFELAFDLDAPLSGPAPNLSNIFLNTDDNSTGLYACGQTAPGFIPITCTASLTGGSVMQAPELDAGTIAAELTLFAGGLCVLRGAKTTGRLTPRAVALRAS